MPLVHDEPLLGLDSAHASRPAGIDAPTYDRTTLRPSIVHIGVGGFHRAHLATYVHELCEGGVDDWAILGAGVLAGDAAMADALESQDHLYSLIVRGNTATEVDIIGSLVGYVRAWDDSTPLVRAIAAPTTQIVSLTVTEGGYPVDNATGGHDPGSPNAGSRSAFGVLAAGLDLRRRSGGTPLTVLSCDNVMGNGDVASIATRGEADRIDPALGGWIDTHVSFPNSMVDRITPTTTDTDRAWLSDTYGVNDRWPVVTEPFRQWVVEDHFAGDRPPFERLDVMATTDVTPYELMKLRLLNAGHSCVAYLASLRGIETVHATLGDADLRAFLEAFLRREAQPVLPPVAGIDIDAYVATLLERFANPNIGDQISRLCLDGSAKFPRFLLPTVRLQLRVGGPVALAALALAGWCQYLLGPAETLSPDPGLAEAVEHARRGVHRPVAFLEYPAVFGDDLAQAPSFVDSFTRSLEILRARGVAAAVSDALAR